MAEKLAESRNETIAQKNSDSETALLSEEEAVEELLRYSGTTGDTADLTAGLFSYFCSLNEILEAPVAELTKFHGINNKTAVLLSLIPQLSRRMLVDHEINNSTGLEAVKDIIPYFFLGMSVENFLLVCLNKDQNIVKWEMISSGSVNASTVDLRKILHIAIDCHAKYVIISHNHPRGVYLPSENDIKTTEVIRKALQSIDVELIDHIIVSPCGCFSITQSTVIDRD